MEKFDTDTPRAFGLIAVLLGLVSFASGMVAGGFAIKLESSGAPYMSLSVIAVILLGGGFALAFTGGICGHSGEKLAAGIAELRRTIAEKDQAIACLQRSPEEPKAVAPAPEVEDPRITALREERDRLIAEARAALAAGRDENVVLAQIQFITDEFQKKGVAA